MKSSGRGFSASARCSSGVISRLIGTPQIACACASSAARSESAAAAPFIQMGSWGGSGSFGWMDIERITVRAAPAHLQGPEHVRGAAGKAAASAALVAPAVRRSSPTPVRATTSPASHPHEEALEDARRQERSEPVVVLIEAEAVQVARRRLEVVPGVERHRLAVRPAQRFTIEREEVLEMPRVEMRPDSPSRSAFGDDEQELAGGVRVASEERVAAESLTAAIGKHVGARRDRQLFIGHANRCCRRQSPQAQAESRRLRRPGPGHSRLSGVGRSRAPALRPDVRPSR